VNWVRGNTTVAKLTQPDGGTLRTAAENRDLLLAAARRLLREQGLANPVHSVTLRAAYEAAGVPQQSAYRLYQGNDVPPQTAFRRDLLAHLLSGSPLSDFDATHTEVIDHITENYDVVTSSGTPYEMGVVFREMMRLATNAWVQAATESDGYVVLVTTAMATQGTDEEAPLSSILRQNAAPNLGVFRSIHDAMTQLFGVRYKGGHTASGVIAMWHGMIHGHLIAGALDPSYSIVYRNTGLDGTPQPWTSVGLLCEALTVRAMEPDPAAIRSMSFEPLTEAKWVDPP